MEAKIWARVLAAIEPGVSRPNFATWLKQTELVEHGHGVAVVAVPNLYAKNWIEKHIAGEICQYLSAEGEAITQINLIIRPRADQRPLDELPLLQNNPSDPEPAAETSHLFNPRYTFETFIVGNNNRLAFAASQVVAEKPGEAYNPLFLYGGVGLGKTHLMQAIGNDIQKSSPKKKIIYTSCEIFTSEFIQSLQEKTIDKFKKKYRSVDVFLIDDIQFLVNKEGTQEEFFHTFNILHQANRQIVVTSDRTPKEITKLEDRLTSRLGWGMVADIQPPNLETRTAILQAKAKEKGVEIKPEVMDYVASAITSNVRELEGSLTKLITTAEIEHALITQPFAQKVLKELLSHSLSSGKTSAKSVIKAVANYYNVETSDLLGKNRVKELVYPRHIAMYLLKTKLNYSYPQVGQALGGRDHTTVMHAVNKIIKELKQNSGLEADLAAIQQGLK